MTLFEVITVLNLVILLYVVYTQGARDFVLNDLVDAVNDLLDKESRGGKNERI